MSDTPRSLDAAQLGAYFALIEVSSLLRHAIEQQLRDAGDLSYVQFQLLARLVIKDSADLERRQLLTHLRAGEYRLFGGHGIRTRDGKTTDGHKPDDVHGLLRKNR